MYISIGHSWQCFDAVYCVGIQAPENMTSSLVRESITVQDVGLLYTNLLQNLIRVVVGLPSLRVSLEPLIGL